MKNLTLYSYQWVDNIDPIENVSEILGWCLDRDSKPYLIRCQNFHPSLYVELPSHIGRSKYRWNDTDAGAVYNHIVKKLGDHRPISGVAKTVGTLTRGGIKVPMLKLEFATKISLDKCNWLLKNNAIDVPDIGECVCIPWEHNINTILQFLVKINLKYCQWFTVDAVKVIGTDQISTLAEEYVCDFDKLMAVSQNISKDWIAMPHCLTFDIETYSDNHKAMPIKTLHSHVAYMISCIYQKISDSSTRKRYLIVLGDVPDLVVKRKIGKTDVEYKIEVIRVKDEFELCNKFADLIAELDPELISGYNILNYDYDYLHARLSRLVKDWNVKASRLIGVTPKLIVPPNWESKAYGYNDKSWVDFPGRLNLDMLPIIRRDYKLPKYDLNTVGLSFLDRGKHDVKAEEMFTIYEEYTKYKALYEKCVKEWKPITSADYDKIKDSDLYVKSCHTDIGDFIPIYHDNIDSNLIKEIVKKYETARSEFGRVGSYCVEDSELVTDLIDKTSIWITITELSNVVYISPFDTYTRGQQIRTLSVLYHLMESLGEVIDYRPPNPNSKYVGGYVGDPDPGMYDHVSTLDFTGLYPSIMIAYNTSHNTYIEPFEDISKLIIDEDYVEIPCDILDDNGNHIGINVHRYFTTKHRVGHLPMILIDLIKERGIAKKQMNSSPEGSFERMKYNAKQLALKVVCNSVYGATGVRQGGVIPILEVAETVTQIGRTKINFCNDYLIEKYNVKIVYNDTDSTMFILPFVKNYIEAIEWANKLEKELTAVMPKPMAVEHEKTGRIIIFKKKKYAYWVCDIDKKIKSNGEYIDNPHYGELKDFIKEPKDAILYRGIILARRDNFEYVRTIYRQTLQYIFIKKDISFTLSYIIKQCIKLHWGRVDWKNLIIIRTMGAHYKSDNYFMNIFGGEIKKLGIPASPGDRLSYLITKTDDKLLGMRLRLEETYAIKVGTADEDRIDYDYYLENLMTKNLEQLFYVGYRAELEKLENKYKNDDKIAIIQTMFLQSKDNGSYITNLWNYMNGNIDSVIDYLSSPDGNYTQHNKFIKARQTAVSGRAVFNPRITRSPLKFLLKAIKMDKLNEYAKVVLLPQDYDELFGQT